MLTLTLTLGWRMIGSSLSPIMPSSLEVFLVPKHEQQLIISLTFQISINQSAHSSNYLSDASCHVTKQFANSTNQLFRYKYNLAQKVKTYSRLFWVFGSMAQRELNVSSGTSRKLLITCKISRKYSIWKTSFLWALAGAAGLSQLLGISMRLA